MAEPIFSFVRVPRPPGELSIELLKAFDELTRKGGSPTMREIALHCQVGIPSARTTMANLVRGGQVEIESYRRVDYRNKPVAEYRLASVNGPLCCRGSLGSQILAGVLSTWSKVQ